MTMRRKEIPPLIEAEPGDFKANIFSSSLDLLCSKKELVCLPAAEEADEKLAISQRWSQPPLPVMERFGLDPTQHRAVTQPLGSVCPH